MLPQRYSKKVLVESAHRLIKANFTAVEPIGLLDLNTQSIFKIKLFTIPTKVFETPTKENLMN